MGTVGTMYLVVVSGALVVDVVVTDWLVVVIETVVVELTVVDEALIKIFHHY